MVAMLLLPVLHSLFAESHGFRVLVLTSLLSSSMYEPLIASLGDTVHVRCVRSSVVGCKSRITSFLSIRSPSL